MTFIGVSMLVQLNKLVVVCGSDLQRGHSGDGCLSSLILFKYESGRGPFVCSELGQVTRVALGSVVSERCKVSGMGVCHFVVLSVVEVCVSCLS